MAVRGRAADGSSVTKTRGGCDLLEEGSRRRAVEPLPPLQGLGPVLSGPLGLAQRRHGDRQPVQARRQTPEVVAPPVAGRRLAEEMRRLLSWSFCRNLPFPE